MDVFHTLPPGTENGGLGVDLGDEDDPLFICTTPRGLALTPRSPQKAQIRAPKTKVTKATKAKGGRVVKLGWIDVAERLWSLGVLTKTSRLVRIQSNTGSVYRATVHRVKGTQLKSAKGTRKSPEVEFHLRPLDPTKEILAVMEKDTPDGAFSSPSGWLTGVLYRAQGKSGRQNGFSARLEGVIIPFGQGDTGRGTSNKGRGSPIPVDSVPLSVLRDALEKSRGPGDSEGFFRSLCETIGHPGPQKKRRGGENAELTRLPGGVPTVKPKGVGTTRQGNETKAQAAPSQESEEESEENKDSQRVRAANTLIASHRRALMSKQTGVRENPGSRGQTALTALVKAAQGQGLKNPSQDPESVEYSEGEEEEKQS